MSHLPSDIFSNGMTDVDEAYKILRGANCWMQMRGGSKLKNFITPSINSLNSSDFVIISGSGPAVTKVVSCAEVVKRRYRPPRSQLIQLTKISYRAVEEQWEPKTEDLEPLKVIREIPQIDILLKNSATKSCDKEHILSNENINVFLNIDQPRVSSKRHKLKSKSGKRTGTTTAAKLDAAKNLGLVDKGYGNSGGSKKATNAPNTKYRQKNVPHDINDSSNLKNNHGV